MGFKCKQNNSFKFGGLIFDSEEDYKSLKRVDNNILNIVKIVKNSSEDLENIFKNIKPINVTETYPDAYDEIDGIYPNATSLLIYEDYSGVCEEYKVAIKFFKKINVKHYIDL